MNGAQSPSFLRPDQLWHELGLRGGETVVHLGCGAGFYLIPAAKTVGKTGKAYGIDIRSDILAEAESRAAREGVGDTVHTLRANLETGKTSLQDAIADWVLVANILHQADPALILPEARRMLKATGTLVVVEWDVAASPLGPPTEVRRSAPEVQKIAEGFGLQLKGKFNPSPYHYGLLFSPAA